MRVLTPYQKIIINLPLDDKIQAPMPDEPPIASPHALIITPFSYHRDWHHQEHMEEKDMHPSLKPPKHREVAVNHQVHHNHLWYLKPEPYHNTLLQLSHLIPCSLDINSRGCLPLR